jgi:predicted ferric reductase
LAYLAVSLLPLALAAFVSAAPLHLWEAIGAALGSVALAAMAIQFLTSGRFEAASGTLGIDEIMAFHKVAALWVLVALVLHPLLYVLPTWRADPDLGLERLIHYHTAPHYRSGVVALAALVLLVPLGYLRARLPVSYEVWRASHVALTLVAVGAGLHHVLTVGRFSVAAPVQTVWWAVAALVAAVMAVLYGLRWARLHRRPWSLGSVTRRADRTWELDIQPDPGTPPLDYEAGQFVWMTEGARRFPLFDHPFSIADSPHRPGLSLIVKEAGDFTDRIGTLAPGTPIGIDGPHGSFTLDRRDADAFVLIAGGVGIAPILGLLRELVARRDPRPVRFVYAVGAPDNFACLDEIEAAKAVLDLQVTLLSETAGAGYEGAVGRLDRDRLGTVLEGLDRGRTAVLMCGPGGMITAVSDTLLDLGLPMDAVEYERFDYAGGLRARKDRRRMAQFLGIGLTLFAAAAGLSLLLA